MSLQDIYFCELDPQVIQKSIISGYESIAKRTLGRADPVRLYLNAIADIIIQQRHIIDNAAKMNLLHYSKGNYLDHIGLLVGCFRNEATYATTTLKITLSSANPRAITVPKGTRVTTGDNAVFFATGADVVIPSGTTTAIVGATALEAGTASNGYDVGEINVIVDPVAYVSTIVNTTKSEGGASIEEDEPYRERIRLAPESFSVAGPKGAYEYWVKTASSQITDVSVTSPIPGKVVIYPLLENGEIPGEEIMDRIQEVLSDNVRPLTDNVFVEEPDTDEYDIEVTYYIDKANKATESVICTAVENAVDDFVLWEKSGLGRDINPSELIRLMVNAGAKRVVVTSPVFTVVDGDSVAVADNVEITYGGLEDG